MMATLATLGSIPSHLDSLDPPDVMEVNPKEEVDGNLDDGLKKMEIDPGHKYCLSAEAALSNELIMAKILESFSKVEDLKCIRAINSTCYRMATKLMAPLTVLKSSRLEYSKMTLKKKRVSLPGLSSDTYYHKYLVFAELNNLLENSKAIPFEAICFHSYMWDLKNPAVIQFFKKFGKGIKTVIFGHMTLRMEDLRELLMVRLAHVEEIVIDEGFNIKLKAPSDVDLFRNRKNRVALRKLKVIRFRFEEDPTYSSLFADMINAAVNLELIDGCLPALFPAVVRANRAVAVKTLIFSDKFLRYYEDFAEAGCLMVKRIIIKPLFDFQVAAASRLLTQILEKSRSSLEAIEFERGLETITYLVSLPVLEQMKYLNIAHLYRCFRTWTSRHAAVTFPNVEEVMVDKDCIKFTKHFREQRLPEDNDYTIQPMPAVRTLFLKGGVFLETSFHFLGSKFPNLRRIEVEVRGPLNENKSLLWSLPKQVETLELTGVRLEDFANYKLDAFLTGIPSNVCAIMQNLQMDSLDFTRFQKKDSILLLKSKLKYFVGTKTNDL